jgi:polysaccharide chain length determinant protein (PEP-CTERM system associated)
MNAMGFLQQQIKEYDRRLRNTEEALAQFKRDNVGMLPGEGGDYYSRLQDQMAALQKLRNDYQLAMQKRAELSRQLNGEEPTFGLFTGTKGTGSLDARISELKAKLDNLLLQFTDKHPDVIAVRETIAQLEAQQEQVKNNVAAAQPAPPGLLSSAAPGDASGSAATIAQKAAMRTLDINPVYQSTKIAVGQVELELVELRTQIGAAAATEHDLRSKVTTIPEVEARLARLNRDYEVNRAQRTTLLQRLESARLSDEASHTSGESRFKVVEKPLVPQRPASPSRLLLDSAILVIAFAAGLGVALGLNIAFPVITTRETLRRLTGVEALGSVSLLEPAGRWYWGPVLVLSSGFGVLVVMYALILGAAVAGLLRI